MTSLQFISHHLFVAAIGQPASRNETEVVCEPASSGSAVALEVLDCSEPLSELAARPLRTFAGPAAG